LVIKIIKEKGKDLSSISFGLNSRNTFCTNNLIRTPVANPTSSMCSKKYY
jgi:hypothetical protein